MFYNCLFAYVKKMYYLCTLNHKNNQKHNTTMKNIKFRLTVMNFLEFAVWIEYQELDIEASQRKISKFTAELEERQAEKAKTISDIEDRTVDLNQKRNELDSILSETKEQTEKLMLRAAELEKHIEDRLVSAFHRIRKNAHNGLAVVKVERDSCGGCHSKIPAQRQLDIRLRKKIIVCELCGRILVDPEIDAKKK